MSPVMPEWKKVESPIKDTTSWSVACENPQEELTEAPMQITKSAMDRGGKSYEEIVVQKALDILKTYRAEPLPEDVQQKINELASKAEGELADIQFVA